MQSAIPTQITSLPALGQLYSNPCDAKAMEAWLRTTNQEAISHLFAFADATRQEHKGAGVNLFALIETSNYCKRRCLYCGISPACRKEGYYRLSADEILSAVRLAANNGISTILLQSGEDPHCDATMLADVIAKITNDYDLSVTISFGEHNVEYYKLWRDAGADRYLIRFETGSDKLYSLLHPDSAGVEERLSAIRTLQQLGYKIGSGMMIGLPGQTYSMLANDIVLLRELNVDMVGMGPYIPHAETPLGRVLRRREEGALEEGDAELLACFDAFSDNTDDYVSPDPEMIYKSLALARIACPDAIETATNATSAMVENKGRLNALQCGANIMTPNLTPAEYKPFFDTYPGKNKSLSASELIDRAKKQIVHLGRTII